MTPLPSFTNPPVTEVVIGARFEHPSNYALRPLARLADSFAGGGFSRVQEQPAYEAPAERFGQPLRTTGVSMELRAGLPPVRYWFLNGIGDELLQLQPNWFACNWRKVAPNAAYGRWEPRWEAFNRWLVEAEQHLADEPLLFDQVEVTYINHIDSQGVWREHSDSHRVFAVTVNPARPGDDFLPPPAQTLVDLTYEITQESDENPIGRLHVTVKPGFKRPGGEPIFVMNLTARGFPPSPGLDGVRRFAEIGHEWIVRGFAELTSPEMHEAWNRVS
jgi:uncharacterized protein (TIGR04255 family)